MRRLIVLGFGLAAIAACGQQSNEDSIPAASQESVRGWEELPAPPLPPRSERVVLWTGAEVLVIGGSTFWCPPNAGCAAPDDPPLRDGAALDLRTLEWRRVADAPVPIRAASTAVVGEHAYLLASTGWGGERTFLRYGLKDDVWEQLPAPDDTSDWYDLVAAGDELVGYPTSHEQRQQPDLTYDPDSGTWRELPPSPLATGFGRTIVGTDEFVYLFDKELVPQPGSEHPSLTRAARLNLANSTWERLPDSEILASGPWLMDDGLFVNPLLGEADGGEVNNWGRFYPDGGIFDIVRNEWRPLPPTEARRAAGAYGTTSALAFDSEGFVLDVAAGRWRELPVLDALPPEAQVDRTVIAAGRAFVAVGGVRTTETSPSPEFLNDAWIWRPPAS